MESEENTSEAEVTSGECRVSSEEDNSKEAGGKKQSWLHKANPIVAMRPIFGWDPDKKNPVWILIGTGFLIGILIGIIVLSLYFMFK